jgi:hypothetical protein
VAIYTFMATCKRNKGMMLNQQSHLADADLLSEESEGPPAQGAVAG